MPYHIASSGDKFDVIDESGKVIGSHPTRKQAIEQQRALYANVSDAEKATAEINDLPDSAFLHIEAGGDKDRDGKTTPRSLRHLPYKTEDGSVDLPKLRNALSRLGQSNTGDSGGDRWMTEELRKSLQAKAEKVLKDNTDVTGAKEVGEPTGAMLHGPGSLLGVDGMGDGKAKKQKKAQEWLDKIFGKSDKEGKRNAATDQEHLNQAHDHLVAAGAICPMVYKESSGKYRWVLLSTNSYSDRDGEIVSQAAQEADVARMKETGNYGPLRLWHLGYPNIETKEAGPGVDIGDCDYAEMFGRVRVESGTFRNDRVAAAIKERPDQWAASIGFLHPVNQPDREGVYTDSWTFERSLLPVSRASNYLAPLAAILKENSMATKEEKIKGLGEMLKDPEAAGVVLKMVEDTESTAVALGLRLKEMGDKKNKPAEGSAEEEADEPETEAEAEGDKPSKEKKKETDQPPAPDYVAMAKELDPLMAAAIDERVSAAMTARTEKEAALSTQITALEARVKEQADALAELKDNAPRAIARGFRPSEAAGNIVNNERTKEISAGLAKGGNAGLDGIINMVLGAPPSAQ